MFTYDDILKKIQESGVSMSDADLKLAQSNPNAAMSIISAKQGYAGAKTPEEQAYWHGLAEETRGQSGGYSGGKYGGSYISLNTPSSYAPAKEAPTYENQYADQIKSALSNIQDRKAWSYNTDSDQAYQAAKKQYMREADRSAADTMGQYAAMTGGMPSTAAMTAGSQASDYYKTQLSDQLGNYINQDYQRYVDQLGADYDKLSALSSLEQGDYGKHQDQLGQHNAENAFNYKQYLDNVDYNTNKEQTQYDRGQDEYERSRYEVEYLVDYYNSLYDATGNKDYLMIAQNLAKSLDTTGILSSTEAQLAAAKAAAASAAAKTSGSSGSSGSAKQKGSSGSYSNYNAGYERAKKSGRVKNRDEYDSAVRGAYKKR